MPATLRLIVCTALTFTVLQSLTGCSAPDRPAKRDGASPNQAPGGGLKPAIALGAACALPEQLLLKAEEQISTLSEAADKADLYMRLAAAYARAGSYEGFTRSDRRASRFAEQIGQDPTPLRGPPGTGAPTGAHWVVGMLGRAGREQEAHAYIRRVAPDGWLRRDLLTQLAAALGEAGALDRATAILTELEPRNRDSVRYRIAVDLARSGRFDEAHAWTKDIEEDDVYRRLALLGITRAHIGDGNLEAALAAAESIEDRGRQVDAFSEVAVAHASAGAYAEAVAAAERVDPSNRDRVLARVTQAAVDRGDFSAAQRVAEQGRDVGAHVTSQIAIAQARQGNMDAALETAAALSPRRQGYLYTTTVSAILEAMAQQRRWHDATALVESLPQERSWKARALLELARSAADASETATAKDLMDRAYDTDPSDAFLFLAIAEMEHELGDPERSRQMIQTLEGAFGSPWESFDRHLLDEYIWAALVRMCDLEAARERLEKINTSSLSMLLGGNARKAGLQRRVGALPCLLAFAEDRDERIEVLAGFFATYWSVGGDPREAMASIEALEDPVHQAEAWLAAALSAIEQRQRLAAEE